jgi:hypothetical protein
MTIHWKALEEHFLMVPFVFRFTHFLGKNAFSEFFSKNPVLKELPLWQKEMCIELKRLMKFSFKKLKLFKELGIKIKHVRCLIGLNKLSHNSWHRLLVNQEYENGFQ